MKESLFASAYTVLLGWWSIYGFFWTLEALFNNARGGEQPKENNAALLNALGYQLYRTGRHQEAYESLLAAFKLKPDPKTEEGLKFLKEKIHPKQKKPFWERFRNLELHPIYYHAPAGAVGLVLLIFGFSALNATSTSGSSSTTQQSRVAYTSPSSPSGQNRQPLTFTPDDFRPTFSEPEQPTPQQGGLEYSYNFANFTGTTAPLKISTRPSDGNYVMKIVDWHTGEFVASYFISRGNTLEIELPLGSYKLKFASGDKWYGTKFLFGPTTAYSYVPDKMVFYLSGDYSRGHRIELIPQVGGNLETPPMRAADW